MACLHKFHKDLYLERLDFEPDTLIIGSFNPAWPPSNTAEWFYGRTKENCFWDVLPRLYGLPSLIDAGPADWKAFCHDHKLALTDLIASIDDADPDNAKHNKMLGGFTDEAIMHNFDDFDYVNIVQLLQRHPSIRNVYLTRGITEAFWRHLWNPVVHYCNANGLQVRTLLPPSALSEYQHSAYNKENPGNNITRLEDYILLRWQRDWHF